MDSPSKSTPRKTHPVIPEGTLLLTPEPLAIDRSLQREVLASAEEMLVSDTEEVQIVEEKKGKSMPSRRSGRITSGVVSTKETVKVGKKKRKVGPMREKKETAQSVHKEPITKRKHDVNAWRR
ncbi:hypothetical protein Dimus_005308 [Dionaea muscipula]